MSARAPRLAAALVLAALAAGRAPASGDAISDQIRQKQAAVSATNAKLEAKRHELSIARARASDLNDQLSETNRSIEQVSSNLDDLTAQVHQSERKLAWNQVQLDAA